MRTVRTLTTALFILTILGTAALAQGPRGMGRDQSGNRGGGQRPAMPDSAQVTVMVDNLAKKAGLSDEQYEQAYEIYQAHFTDMREGLADNGGRSSGNRDDHREQMDQIRQEFEAEIQAVLDDDQYEVFQKIMSKNQRSGPPNRQGRR